MQTINGNTARRGASRREFIASGVGIAGIAGLAKAQGGVADPVQIVREHARPLTGSSADFDPVLSLAQNASFVLIGEASHGTHEFYSTRAEITRRLIEELGFNAVVAEADWPDAQRVNRYIQGAGDDESAEASLSSFNRYPEWMWRNTDVRDFAEWLRNRNAGLQEGGVRAGFYGMDLYSLLRSRDAVLNWLRQVDQSGAERAEERYAAFRNLTEPDTYGYLLAYGRIRSAQAAVTEQFEQVQRIAAIHRNSSDPAVADAAFDAEQNARVLKNAEEYYREMYSYGVNTWNLRDRHMVDTIDALAEYLTARHGYARIAVWAHNSHLGDARATDSALRGEWNVGQLVRERHEGQTVLVGFSTHTGSVMASYEWGEAGVVKQVRPSLANSWERVFHQTEIPGFVLPLQDEAVRQGLARPLLQRAIGVMYRPETERQSHYFQARLPEQFDVMIHFDESRAVEPLPGVRAGEVTDLAA